MSKNTKRQIGPYLVLILVVVGIYFFSIDLGGSVKRIII